MRLLQEAVSLSHMKCDFMMNKQEGNEGNAAPEETKKSNHVLRVLEKRQQARKLDSHVEEQFGSGRGLAFHLDQVNVPGLMGKSHMWHYLC